MSAVTDTQRCGFRLVLTCVYLIVLLGISPRSSPTLVTAEDVLARDDFVPLPEGAQQVELDLAMPVPVPEYLHSVGPSDPLKEAVVEVSVDIPLGDAVFTKHGVPEVQLAHEAAAAAAEEQKVIEMTRMSEEILNVEEARRAVQAEREEEVVRQTECAVPTADRHCEEKERTATEAWSAAEVDASQKVLEKVISYKVAMGEDSLPSAARSLTEGNDPDPLDSGALHATDHVQDTAVHHSRRSPLPVDPPMEAEPSPSPVATTTDTNPYTEEKVNAPIVEEIQRTEEVRIAVEVRQEDKARYPEEMYRKAEESKLLEETKSAQQVQKVEQVRINEETTRQAEAAQHAEVSTQAEAAWSAEEVTRQTEAARQVEEVARSAEEALERAAGEGTLQAEEAPKAAEERRAEEGRKTDEERLTEEARQAEEHLKAKEARLAQEAQRAEETRLAEEARLAEARRLDAEAQKAEEEARRAETMGRAEERRAEVKLKGYAVAESAAQLRKETAGAQERLTAERKEVLTKIDEERTRFQAATADLTKQQEQEKSSAAQHAKVIVTELQMSMGKRLEALQQDLLTLRRASVTLQSRVSALLESNKPLAQVQEDVQVLDEEVRKAAETFDNIRGAADSVTDMARAAVGSQSDASAATSEKITLLTEQKRALETARDAAIQELLGRLQTLDVQLSEVAKQTGTQEAAVAEPSKTSESAAITPRWPVAPPTAKTSQEAASPPSEAPRPEETAKPASALFAPLAEPRTNPSKDTEKSRGGYRCKLIETLGKWAEEKGYNKSSYEVHPHEDGAPYQMKGYMQIVGTVVVITIAASIQTLRWCRSGGREEEKDGESPKTVTSELQSTETSSALQPKPLSQSGGPSPQGLQTSPPSISIPRGANVALDRGDRESSSHWEGGSASLSSQRGTPSAVSEQVRLSLGEGRTVSRIPMRRNHLDAFPPGTPVSGISGATLGPPCGGSPLDTARAPPLSSAASPFTVPRREALGVSSSSKQWPRPLAGGPLGEPPSLPLSRHLPIAGTSPQMQRRQNDGDEFDLHNPFLSRWL
ncbi:hypothetical protein, conserved [Leishmania lindenbergi]|uniref:Kinetoplast-associated protein-like protein n=1 Tax=Leishmania lindenbergi TaxID=651832 RepID=A0AAW3AIU7_9TRYP